MSLMYKLEYIYDSGAPSDCAVFIHLRDAPPVYLAHITKEDYDWLDSSLKNDFASGLLNVAGLTEISIKAYRVWLMKSPVYTWEEVLIPVLYFIAESLGKSGIFAIQGSADYTGSGFTVPSQSQRRKI